MKKIAIVAVSCLILLASGCSNTSVTGAKQNLRATPITKVCIKHVNGKGSLQALEPLIVKAFTELGYKTEMYNYRPKFVPSEDCSHLVSYQVRSSGNTVKKFNSNLYIYFPDTNSYERIGKVKHLGDINADEADKATSALVALYKQVLYK